MAINKKLFWENLKKTLKNVGASSRAVLSGLEKSDKEMNEKMKNILKSAD